MYELKTKATAAGVEAYIDAIEDPTRRADCRTLVDMMSKATGCPPKMWGPTIVGFDQYHYRYESGHEGDMCIIGFANRKSEVVLYLLDGSADPKANALLEKVGKHRRGKSCLYFKKLAGLDLGALEQLIDHSVAQARARYPG
ncbi:MAG: DUF1801 domain-containing protein [Gemmatimonadaceae bacterium]|nr:DUF1801 domain-containing protein [Gemmatimonadaceae bacterium]